MTLALRKELFLVVLLLPLIARTEDAETVDQHCMKEHGVTEEEAEAFQGGPDAKPALLCYMKCIFEGLSYLESDGSLALDVMKKDDIVEGKNKEDIDSKYQCLEKLGKITECKDIVEIEKCTEPEKFS